MNFSLSRPNSWVIGTLLVSFMLILPVLSVFYLAFGTTGEIWRHLVDTSLSLYVSSTIALMFGVGLIVFVTGVSTAWLVTMCRFPGCSTFEWLLIFPLAFPSYVVAYAYTDLLEYAGPIQSVLRAMFGWNSPLDYWFPEIRTLGGAMLMMGFVLYPYVYLMARSAFLEMSVNVLEVQRVLGGNAWQIFNRVAFPSARPAIAVGVSLALMETMNDYGTVDYFAVSTMTVGLIDVWLGMGSLAGAAQIAVLMLTFIMALVLIERTARANQKLYQQPRSRFQKLPTYELRGARAWLSVSVCLLPVLTGFVIPLLVLMNLAVNYFDRSWSSDYFTLVINSVTLSASAALFVVILSLFLAYGGRLSKSRFLVSLTKLCRLGYAVPGAVLAIGIIVPMAFLDNSIDAWFRAHIGISTGLLLTGSVTAVIYAYVVRFLVLGLGQVESSLAKISPSMDMAARTLGNKPGQVLIRFHLPVIKGGVLVASMLVFVDCMKELPATLLLRPFNFETLATHVYLFASDEMLGEAALGSVSIVAVGLLPVIFLSIMVKRSRSLK